MSALAASRSESARRVEAALAAIREGRMVILTDDADRENEGDLTLAAEMVTPEAIAFMARVGRGLICLSLTEEKVQALQLPLMVAEAANGSGFGTAFTVSIEAREGVSTGISAADRAHTIRTAVRAGCRPDELARPGHVFPLRARAGGVLVRAGQTEGSVDLARLAGLAPAGVICEVMNADGTMARRPELEVLAREHDLVLLSVADLIAYRLEREPLVRPAAEVELPTVAGTFRAVAFESELDAGEHVALVKGRWRADEPVLVRVHRRCFLGDVFGGRRCGCAEALDASLRRIEAAGKGVLLYLDAGAGQGSGLACHAPGAPGSPGPRGRRPLDADLREYGLGAQILRALGVRRMRLLTRASRGRRVVALGGHGLEVVEEVALEPPRPPRRRDGRAAGRGAARS
ncbi:MAG: 3,4-dihydroxy-2-butanone-4-phosphate synthase [Anaeromyxobacter sp.]